MHLQKSCYIQVEGFYIEPLKVFIFFKTCFFIMKKKQVLYYFEIHEFIELIDAT